MREKITTKEIVSRKADICASYFISQYNFFCIALVPKRSTKWKNENLQDSRKSKDPNQNQSQNPNTMPRTVE
jgi:hypothetical protein